MNRNNRYLDLYNAMRSYFGYLDWWPGETRDEIMVGAILTQQTQWRNVEIAIGNLKGAGLIELAKIAATGHRTIEGLIRPSGFYRQKAKCLIRFASYICSRYGSIDGFFDKSPGELRKELLSIKGIGKETADSIILYAANKPAFVIDAYTKRIMHRVYGIPIDIEYDDLQSLVERSIKAELELYKDFHAQFVELGKKHCRTKPICKGCPVNSMCLYYKKNVRK